MSIVHQQCHNWWLSPWCSGYRFVYWIVHGIPLFLSFSKRHSCTHVHWIYQAAVHFSASSKSAVVLAVLFTSHFIFFSSKALFYIQPFSDHPSCPYSSQTSIARGTWYIFVLVPGHITRYSMTRELLPAPCVPSECKRWCKMSGHLPLCPPSCLFLHFWPYDLFSHTHTHINLILIHCSSELFCSLQILFYSLFHLLLLGRGWYLSQER